MSTSRFGINACFLRHGRVGGIEQGTVNLIEGLRSLIPPAEEWSVYSREPLVTDFDVLPVRTRILPDLPRMNRMAYEPIVLAGLRQPDAWLHLNYVTPGNLRAPSVTVVNDLQYRHFPENFSKPKHAWMHYAHAATARRADRIVAISEFTAEDIRRTHGRKVENKVEVIPHAVSLTRLQGDGRVQAGPTGRPYVLSVAAHYKHKNLQTLIEAHQQLRKRHDVDLVLVGQRRDELVGRASAVELGDSGSASRGVHFTGFVTDHELGAWYRGASVFAFPSVFEGQGLPVVEALGLRVPTITTRCGAIPEAGGDLPAYVEDPRNPGEWADMIGAVLDSPALARPDEAEAASLQARYAPLTIAAQFADVVRAAAGN